jgi:hypothetical protein
VAAPVTATPVINTQIADCAGVPGGNAEVDCCGVCGGDGTTCPELCKEINNKPVKNKIRREVQRVTNATLKRITQETKCSKASGTTKKRKIETLSLRREVRILLEGLEDTIKLCDTPFCKRTSLTELQIEIDTKVRSLVRMDKLSQRLAIKVCCKRSKTCGSGKSTGVRGDNKFTQFLSELPDEKCD